MTTGETKDKVERPCKGRHTKKSMETMGKGIQDHLWEVRKV
jgi:hypothetical protein